MGRLPGVLVADLDAARDVTRAAELLLR